MEAYTFEDYCKGKFSFRRVVDNRYRIGADILEQKDLSKTYIMWVVENATGTEVEFVEKSTEEDALESLIALVKKYSR